VYGPCRSTIGGGQALTPPKRHCLGKPLPYQLADTPQAILLAINLYSPNFFNNNTAVSDIATKKVERDYQVLSNLSTGYS